MLKEFAEDLDLLDKAGYFYHHPSHSRSSGCHFMLWLVGEI